MSNFAMNRRSFIGATGAIVTSLLVGPAALGAASNKTLSTTAPDVGVGPYRLPPLPYAYDALERAIDERTMRIHHDAHHAGYVRNLNNALKDAKLNPPENPVDLIRGISELPKDLQKAVRNNGGGHVNHTFFWTLMSPEGGGRPDAFLMNAINRDFGSFDKFKSDFEAAGSGVFGSGWAWLCVDQDGKLFVTNTSNQDNPVMDVVEQTGSPILGCDVWEHAYYLRYQNKRGDYLKKFWDVVYWPAVSEYARISGVRANKAS